MNSSALAADNPAAIVEMSAGENVDAVEEMRLRTWARQNFVPAGERNVNWHPVVLDEKDGGR